MLRVLHRRCFSSTNILSSNAVNLITPLSVNNFLLKEWSDACYSINCHEVSSSHVLVSQAIPKALKRPGPHGINNYVSGPAQFSLADIAMWISCFGSSGLFVPMALTSELSIRFIRPAIGQILWARVNINAINGRSIISTTTL
jgi:hypothetical protein